MCFFCILAVSIVISNLEIDFTADPSCLMSFLNVTIYNIYLSKPNLVYKMENFDISKCKVGRSQ